MKLQEQVCSLELSQQLKELGYKQESLFYYKVDEDREMGTSLPYLIMGNSRYMTSKGELLCSAPTVAELGMALAKRKHGIMPNYNSNSEGGWYVTLVGNEIWAETEADCRAKLLIHLLQNKLIEL